MAYVYNSEEDSAQHFGYDGDRMIVAMDDAYGLLWQSFQGPELDLILEFHDANQAVIPLIDHRRSIAGAWDMEDGFMVGVATYDAEGRVAQYSNDEALECNEVGNQGVNCNAPGGLPFGLNAKWRSPMTGFVNMHHRWYSPRMGEFLSHDPLGYIDTYNLFGFATFDPINGYDPFGLETRGYIQRKMDQTGKQDFGGRNDCDNRACFDTIKKDVDFKKVGTGAAKQHFNDTLSDAKMATCVLSTTLCLLDKVIPNAVEPYRFNDPEEKMGANLYTTGKVSVAILGGLGVKVPRAPLRIPFKFDSGIRNHMTSIVGFSQKKGVMGAHTTTAFAEAQARFNLKIVNIKAIPNQKGIYEIKYRIPAKDRAGNFTAAFKGDGASPFRKTVYDPNVISSDRMMQLGTSAANASQEGVRTANSASGGIGFRVYFDKSGRVTNFHPSGR